MDKRGWRRAAYGAIAIALLAMILAGGARSGWWEALAGDQPDKPWGWVERVGWITGTLGLPATIVFGILAWWSDRKLAGHPISEQEDLRVSVSGTDQPPVNQIGESVPRTSQPDLMLDRDYERHELRTRLTDGPWGVIVVRGQPGVGKSKLVHAVVEELKQEAHDLRVRRHEATPDVRLDIKTLIDDIDGGASSPVTSRHGESSLARLEVSLEALGDTPVVIVIDCAENLVNRNNKRLVDVDLDEAFEVLATRPQHRVAVVLVTQVDPDSPEGRTWPSAERPIVITTEL